jgi:hypothetical protein
MVTEVALYFGRLLPLLLGPWIAQHLMTEVALFGRLMPSLVGLWFAWQRIVSEGALTGNVQPPLLGPWILQLVLTEVALFGRLLPTMVGLWFMQPLVTEGAWFVCFLSSLAPAGAGCGPASQRTFPAAGRPLRSPWTVA